MASIAMVIEQSAVINKSFPLHNIVTFGRSPSGRAFRFYSSPPPSGMVGCGVIAAIPNAETAHLLSPTFWIFFAINGYLKPFKQQTRPISSFVLQASSSYLIHYHSIHITVNQY
jgi:hypothetical protein